MPKWQAPSSAAGSSSFSPQAAGEVCTGKSSMRLKGDCRGQCCQVSPANSLSSRQRGGDGEEGGRLGRSPVHSGSDSPQHWDVAPRLRIAQMAAGGAAGKRGLSLLPRVLCQEEERNSLRRKNFPVHVKRTTSPHSSQEDLSLSLCLAQTSAP